MNVAHIIRQIRRGAGTLPHVGPHPGTPIFLVLAIMFILAGIPDRWWFGIVAVAVTIAPLWLWGCYDRAQFSDQLERLERGTADRST